jgi:cytoskeletal protein CcmA (bactofilin family)
VCYECGYRFTVAGKVRTLYCAKCRTVLNQTDYTIDKEHDVSIVTAGSVTIAEGGVWTGGSLFARDVVLKGGHTGGTLRATRRLEVHPGAVYRLEAVDTERLVVAEGAEVVASSPMVFKEVEIHGRLEGELTAEGVVRIHPGGHFVGRLVTQHLVVEEGGGLTGEMVIGAPLSERSVDTGDAR